ncbi:unnamed protein product [Hermetia illucens]|uniref:Uncharacterized protein n=1 Tax=Hermetia illucens TaxID=343691 RepID=A0A7R8UM33_HERIL|nr:unnamed protein product [Hermetia illucens]
MQGRWWWRIPRSDSSADRAERDPECISACDPAIPAASAKVQPRTDVSADRPGRRQCLFSPFCSAFASGGCQPPKPVANARAVSSVPVTVRLERNASTKI